MQINYNNERAFYGSLEEVFTKALSATELLLLYRSFFYGVKKQTSPNKRLVKADMVKAFMGLTGKPEDFHLFLKTLPKKVYQAYELLLWQDSMVASEAQKVLGFKIIQKEQSENKWILDKYVIKQEFSFIALIRNHNYPTYYADEESLEGYLVSIPPALRKWLKTCFPKPEGHQIRPLPDTTIADKKYAIFDASPTIAADLGQLADFLKRGTVKRTLKGDLTKVSIRKAESLTESGEWYPEEDKKSEITLMRHALLLDFIEGFEGGLMHKLTAPEIQENVFKDILKALQEDEEMIAKWLLGHLKQRYKYYEETFKPEAISRLFSMFGQLPPDAWVSVENLKSMQLYQDIDVLFFDPNKYGFEAISVKSEYKYEMTHKLDLGYLKTAGIDPLIDGMAFLLSAFGFVELAYKAPHNKTFRTYKNPYLTHFDGAQAVRLTEIGAYAFGHRSKLKLKQSRRKVAILKLHPEQLHVTCQDLDPVTELALKEFMEPVAPEFYQMTRASLLKGCQSPKDVKHRIADFRKRLPVELPENWEQFLGSLEAEKSALIPERTFKIFTLVDRPDLQRLFIQDQTLRRLALRVEGHRIAIEQKDIAQVRLHLRKLGYLVET